MRKNKAKSLESLLTVAAMVCSEYVTRIEGRFYVLSQGTLKPFSLNLTRKEVEALRALIEAL